MVRKFPFKLRYCKSRKPSNAASVMVCKLQRYNVSLLSVGNTWKVLSCISDMIPHFLPPGVACTTGLSHNPFTWRPLKDGRKRLRQK